ncbi:MAG: hypothetical protein NT104_05945 [Bacteroidetes bacterium]|nr:hypothetical protein [Bacteroidota bacterium]
MKVPASIINLSFIAKVAIICNAFYLFSLLVMNVHWVKLPEGVINFFAVLGLEMAPGVNIAFFLAWAWVKLTKSNNFVENWKTILIILMLCIQIGAIFFSQE